MRLLPVIPVILIVFCIGCKNYAKVEVDYSDLKQPVVVNSKILNIGIPATSIKKQIPYENKIENTQNNLLFVLSLNYGQKNKKDSGAYFKITSALENTDATSQETDILRKTLRYAKNNVGFRNLNQITIDGKSMNFCVFAKNDIAIGYKGEFIDASK